MAAQAAPPPQSRTHCRSQAGLPPLLDVDELDDDEDEDEVVALSVQRPSASWTQTDGCV